MPSRTSPVAEVLKDLAVLLRSLDLRWYLFGAQAALIYGTARLTADVDVTVELKAETPQRLAAALLRSKFRQRVPLDTAFIAASRVIPVTHVKSGLPVDVVLAGPGLEELIFDRVRQLRMGGMAIPVVSPEDLVVLKVLAGRPTDLADIDALLVARRSTLKVATIRHTLAALQAALDVTDLIPVFEGRWKSVRARTRRQKK